MNNVHTLRGRVDPSSQKRLIIDDGRFNHAMKVESFVVWPANPNSSEDPKCVLSLSDNAVTSADASDTNQIGWSKAADAITIYSGYSILDPNHLVVRDLYITNLDTQDDANYLVILSPMVISDDRAIMALIKERSQDDL